MKVTTDRFLIEAEAIHGALYVYPSDLVVPSIDVDVQLRCKIHGQFTTSFRKHVTLKHGCQKCGKEVGRARAVSRTGTTNGFIEKARAVHGDRYDYSEVVYATIKDKVWINCSEHGPFLQTPNMHISNKQGCPDCFSDRRHLLSGGYKRQIKLRKNTDAGILYLLRFKSDTESFIKIGITTRDIARRWGKTKYLDYQLEVMFQYSTSICKAYDIEQQCISHLSANSYYKRDRLRNGNTECFNDTPEVVSKLLHLMEQESKDR